MRGFPHSDAHLYVGATGNMGTMRSPDDPLFYLHHSNLDRYWAIWSDCYLYDAIDPKSYVTPVHMTKSWYASTPSGSKIKYDMDTPMPYIYLSLNKSMTATRLSDNPIPRDMGFIGYNGKPGFASMYYVYGPDPSVDTMMSDPEFSFFCPSPIDTLVNYYPPGTSKKRSGGEQVLFNSQIQSVLTEINGRFWKRTPKQKLRYLALWECSDENNKNRSHELPPLWIKMNGQTLSDFKTVCDFFGRNGYLPLALAEDQADIVTRPSLLIPIIISTVLVILIIFGIVGFILWREYYKTIKIDNETTQPMLDRSTI
eukprot:TRINITY_DN11090_c0_g1_i1.p1 TRINITY_DN11090_c0_g1~~TRINITY_DN11090_c0_g1_i1.p1  ORF type:complete len:332 (-),score=31.51 TRINITY_DN11090_c0_g1_i1:80-1015(-)